MCVGWAGMGVPVVGPFSNFLHVKYNRSNKSSPPSSVLLLSASFSIRSTKSEICDFKTMVRRSNIFRPPTMASTANSGPRASLCTRWETEFNSFFPLLLYVE